MSGSRKYHTDTRFVYGHVCEHSTTMNPCRRHTNVHTRLCTDYSQCRQPTTDNTFQLTFNYGSYTASGYIHNVSQKRRRHALLEYDALHGDRQKNVVFLQVHSYVQ